MINGDGQRSVTQDRAPETATSAPMRKKPMMMRMNCALYRAERKGDRDYFTLTEYCDGLEYPFCKYGEKCPFFKSYEEWKPVVVKKQTQYVRV